ncbi:MAG: hypothetical protein U0798_05480 [Gemmataceae bacterium]
MSNDASKMKFDPIPVLPPGIAPPSAETKPSATAAPKPSVPASSSATSSSSAPKTPEKAPESKPAPSSITTPASPSNPNNAPGDWLSSMFTPSKNMGVIAIAACSLVAGWYGVRTLFPPASHNPDQGGTKQSFVSTNSTDAKNEAGKSAEPKSDLPPNPEKLPDLNATASSVFANPKVEPIAPQINIGGSGTGEPIVPTVATPSATIAPVTIPPNAIPTTTNTTTTNPSGIVPAGHQVPAPSIPVTSPPDGTKSINLPDLQIPNATTGTGSNNSTTKVPEIVPAGAPSSGPPIEIAMPSIPGVTVPAKKEDKPAPPAAPGAINVPKLEIPAATTSGTGTGAGTTTPPAIKSIEVPKIGDTGTSTAPPIPNINATGTGTPVLPPPAATTTTQPGGISLITPDLTNKPTAAPAATNVPKIEAPTIPPTATPTVTPTITPTITPTVTPSVTPAVTPPSTSLVLPSPTTPTTVPSTPSPLPSTPASTASIGSRPDPKLLPVNNTASSEVKTDFDVDLYYPKANESYADIAKIHYGDARYGAVLSQFNQTTNRGTSNAVQLPPTWWVKRQMGAPVSAPGSAPSSASAPNVPDGNWTPAAATNANSYRIYTIPTGTASGGMTFKEIARQAYGSEDDWQRVFNLNSRYSADAVIPANTKIKLTNDARIGQ